MMARALQGNLEVRNIKTVDVGFQKSFFNDKLSVNLAVNDIFNSLKFNIYSNTTDYSIHAINKEQTRYVSLQLVYNFSIGKKISINKNNKSDEQLERLGH